MNVLSKNRNIKFLLMFVFHCLALKQFHIFYSRLIICITLFTSEKTEAQTTFYVSPMGNQVFPFNNWTDAATNIQDAVDAASPGDTVMVTNGIYASGGRIVHGAMSNRVAVIKPLTLKSVNGPTVTVIKGNSLILSNRVRCVYLTNGAMLIGFTLTNGTTLYGGSSVPEIAARERCGGGVWCESSNALISNCIVISNSAYYYGGGVLGGTLKNCLLIKNSASYGGGACSNILYNCLLASNTVNTMGGGVWHSELNNCTIFANSANSGAGASDSLLNNCISYYNGSGGPIGNHANSTFNFSCTTPKPANGIGNFTNAPLFANVASGNLHLQTNSPCIDTGENVYAYWGPDFDGRPRIVGGVVDIGAYEFQGNLTNEFINWLIQYKLTPDAAADVADFNANGLSLWHEWMADISPTNANSTFHAEVTGSSNLSAHLGINFTGSTNRLYTLYRAETLTGGTWTNVAGQTDIPGSGDKQFLTDSNFGPMRFYRLGVRLP